MRRNAFLCLSAVMMFLPTLSGASELSQLDNDVLTWQCRTRTTVSDTNLRFYIYENAEVSADVSIVVDERINGSTHRHLVEITNSRSERDAFIEFTANRFRLRIEMPEIGAPDSNIYAGAFSGAFGTRNYFQTLLCSP